MEAARHEASSTGPPAHGGRAPPPDHREIGARGERLAREHFERLGFAIIDRNVRTRQGEIDLVAYDGCTLVFAEVKTRRLNRGREVSRTPLDRLGAQQRARLRRLAGAWLSERRPRPYARAVRLDAVGVTLDARLRLLGLEHIEAAW